MEPPYRFPFVVTYLRPDEKHRAEVEAAWRDVMPEFVGPPWSGAPERLWETLQARGVLPLRSDQGRRYFDCEPCHGHGYGIVEGGLLSCEVCGTGELVPTDKIAPPTVPATPDTRLGTGRLWHPYADVRLAMALAAAWESVVRAEELALEAVARAYPEPWGSPRLVRWTGLYAVSHKIALGRSLTKCRKNVNRGLDLEAGWAAWLAYAEVENAVSLDGEPTELFVREATANRPQAEPLLEILRLGFAVVNVGPWGATLVCVDRSNPPPRPPP